VARLGFIGPCLPTSGGPEGGQINAPVGPGRWRGQLAMTLSKLDNTDAFRWRLATLTTPIKVSYHRLYLRVREAPTADFRIWGVRGTIEGSDDAGYLAVGSDRRIYGYSKGNGAKTLIGTITTPLTLNQVYRVNIWVDFNNVFKATLNGASYPALGADSATGFHKDCSVGTTGLAHDFQLASLLSIPSQTGGEQNGGQFDLFDAVADDSAEPGPGGVTLVQVTGQGVHDCWTTGGNFRSVIARLPSPSTAPQGHANTTLGATTSYTLQTFDSKGLTGRTFKSARLALYGRLPRADWQYLLRKNGVDTLSALMPAAAFTDDWKAAPPGSPNDGLGWFLDSATLSLSPSDTVEIGVVDGPAGAGTATLSGAYLLIEWEGPDVVLPEPATIVGMAPITYVGDGSARDVSFVDPTYLPTLLIVQGDATGAGARAIWHRGMDEAGNYATRAGTHDNSASGICRVFPGGFSVKGAAGSINTSGVTYRVFAFRDNAKRLINTGNYLADPGANGVDNFDVALDDLAFGIEALFVFGQRFGSSGVGHMRYRSNDYGPDSSSPIDVVAAAAPDGIQSHGVGTFQVGTLLTSNVNSRFPYAAMRTTPVTQRRLLCFFKYVGDGSGARVIPYSCLDSAVFLIIIPANTAGRFYRFFGDGLGATSRQWADGATNATAITAFDVDGSFTIGATLNVGGVDFHVLLFGAGEDPALPVPCPIVFPPGVAGTAPGCASPVLP